MKREVRLLPSAQRDLSRLVSFLEEKSSAVARRGGDVIKRALRSLDHMAERGRRGPTNDKRELVVPFGRDAYIIQYCVETELVIVSRVFHSRESRD